MGMFNVTSSHRYPPKLELYESYSTIGSVFGFSAQEMKQPVMYVNGRNMILVSLRENVLATFQSNLPQSTPPSSTFLKWLPQPIFVCAIIVVGVWQFCKRRQSDSRDDKTDFMRQMRQFEQRQRSADMFVPNQRNQFKFE
eukprot:TRINITY_DN2134_c1_g1_i1.p2 TRINITY_DN2134_c1_g1~~TRINITY_DN2134_c1_g1_i1.p2  ORF type:complete len:140 (-),score=12.07 TRINITY_DN2134_c1_g1_i1:121-540(-)